MVKAASLSCPNCGGPVTLRGFAHTLSVVCPQCLSVLDTFSPLVQILQTFQGKTRIEPTIPLGSRGKFGDTNFEVIGFQIREVQTEDANYGWAEYLLFNPYKGFRYLSEYQGHWNYIRVAHSLPEPYGTAMRFESNGFSRFSQADAVTSYVIGEFPWRVRTGDRATVNDYISPPFMLSSEQVENEVTWSLGEYYSGAQIWKAFQLPGKPPPAQGVFANQPSPVGGTVKAAWKTWVLLMAALLAIVFFFSVTAGRREVFRQKYNFTPGTTSEASYVTEPFELTGKPSNVEIKIDTDLRSDWAYFNFALINEGTGQTRDFGREVSYYGDEGSPRDRVVIPHVASGKYYLRVEPEKTVNSGGLKYEITVRRDVPTYGWFWVCAVLLTIPPVVKSIRRASFETTRWRESDFSRTSGK